MMHEMKYWKLTYPKNYIPGMEYEKRFLGKTYCSSLALRTKGTDTVLWKGAARLRITCDVDTFQIRRLDEKHPWFAGTL